jgi:hypothetical protein
VGMMQMATDNVVGVVPMRDARMTAVGP